MLYDRFDAWYQYLNDRNHQCMVPNLVYEFCVQHVELRISGTIKGILRDTVLFKEKASDICENADIFHCFLK